MVRRVSLTVASSTTRGLATRGEPSMSVGHLIARMSSGLDQAAGSEPGGSAGDSSPAPSSTGQTGPSGIGSGGNRPWWRRLAENPILNLVPLVALVVASGAFLLGKGRPLEWFEAPRLCYLTYPRVPIDDVSVASWLLTNEGRGAAGQVVMHVSLTDGSLIGEILLQCDHAPKPVVEEGGEGYDHARIVAELLPRGKSITLSVIASDLESASFAAHSGNQIIGRPFSACREDEVSSAVVITMLAIAASALVIWFIFYLVRLFRTIKDSLTYRVAVIEASGTARDSAEGK